MKLIQNFHIHSLHSCDSACATILDIMAEMKNLGVGEFGLTDHYHTSYNLPDIVSARRDFLASRPPKNFHFGIEVSVVDQRECDRIAAGDYTAWGDEPVYGFRDMTDYTGKFVMDLTEDTIREQGIEFVVGGIHWPLCLYNGKQEMIKHYRDLQLFLIQHPLVDILAHPWDSLDAAAGDWYIHRDEAHIDRSVFSQIPAEYNQQLAEALLKYNKLAEINASVICNANDTIRRFYMETFCDWKQRGVKFTLGTDQHSAHASKEKIAAFEGYLTEYGFTENDIVIPKFRNFTQRY